MTDHRGSSRGRRRSSSEIRSEIAETRARLANDIDAARMKLSKRGLQNEAMERLSSIRGGVSDAMSSASHSADNQASHLGQLAVDTIKRYPMITTLVGLGLAMLAFSNGRRLGGREHQEQEMQLAKPTTAADLPTTRY